VPLGGIRGVYLLFVDESGTHGGSHAFALGGVAIHEDDAARLQRLLDQLVIDSLGRVPPNLEEYELHVSEMRNAKKPPATSMRRPSIWAAVPRKARNALLDKAYRKIVSFTPTDPQQPLALFGVVVDASFRSNWVTLERERFTYEVLLNKFDVMLKRLREQHNRPNRGLVIHDRRVLAEQDIQSWTSEWRAAAGSIGQLRNLADVPLFSDSRATRLLQVADLVSYAIYRRYRPKRPQDISKEPFAILWPRFDSDSGTTHGCVHYTPYYGQRTCDCQPCEERLLAQ
jgi:hypothetical protein